MSLAEKVSDDVKSALKSGDKKKLAIARFLVYFIIFIEGSSPSIPDIAFIVKNDFLLFFLSASSIEK